MVTENGISINPSSVYEVILRHLDAVGGCFLSDLGSILGQRGLVFSIKELNDALEILAKTRRFILSFRLNGSHPDLYINVRHYPSTYLGIAHDKNSCNDSLCNTCHPGLFA